MIINKKLKEEIKFLHEFLISNNKTLTLAESCTGGFFAKLLTDISGSSNYLKGSIVCYSNEFKINILNVDKTIIENWGAVSEETAYAMIEGLKKLSYSDYYIAITGIAGPGGGSLEKPVGTVFIACSGNKKTVVEKFKFPGERDQIRKQSIIKSIQILKNL